MNGIKDHPRYKADILNMNLFIPGNAGDKIIKIDIEKKLDITVSQPEILL